MVFLFSVLHILPLISLLAISTVIGQKCLFTDQTWGDENPINIFYCNSETNAPEITKCRSGTGYIRNKTVSGCVDWKDWNDGCILRESIPEIKSCNDPNSLSPRPVPMDPSSYYLCSSSAAKPIVMACPANRGFVAHNGYRGCIPWGLWRNVTGCNN